MKVDITAETMVGGMIAVLRNRINIRNWQPELTWIWFYILHIPSKELEMLYFLWEIWYINQELEAMGEERRKSQQFMAKLQLSVCTSQLHQTSLFSETAASKSVLLSCFCDFCLGLLLLMWLICPLSYNQPLASISTTCFLLEDLFLFAS